MKWRTTVLAAALAAAGSAQAQTITARSGEHDGFTRLVMRLPQDTAWSVSQDGSSASVNLDLPGAVIDTSQVFRRIARTRIQDLRQSSAGAPLQIALGCDCDVVSFAERGRYLVVDIRDAPANSGRPVARAVLPSTLSGPDSGYRFGLGYGAGGGARYPLSLGARAGAAAAPRDGSPAPQTDPQTAPDARAPQVAAPAAGVAVEDSADIAQAPRTKPDISLLLDLEEARRAEAVSVFERRLAAQIGRASSQGLLDASVSAGQGGGREVRIDPLPQTAPDHDPLDHISITSAVDRETGLAAPVGETFGTTQHCIPDAAIAVGTWGGEDGFGVELGRQRAALASEFDKVSGHSVTALAKTYLYYGFGAEARALLRMLPSGAEDDAAARLGAMAVLMDGGRLPPAHAFSGQQNCGGAPAMWAVLADGRVKTAADREAVQRSFAALPAHLRTLLGPRLATLFAAAGDSQAASAVLRAVRRTGPGTVPDMNMAEAAMAGLDGDTETQAGELAEEVVARTVNAPRALIELIDLSFDERKALPPDVPELAASYELEARDSDLGADLRKASVAALALTGDYHQAFDALADLTGRDGAQARAEAQAPLMTLLAERAGDVTFLHYALLFSEAATAEEAMPVADPVARRLLDLGFAGQAQSLLRKLALDTADEARRLMLAEAALALGTPQQALVELMGLESSDANRLRARALWQNGEYLRSGEYMLVEDQTAGAARGFWHGDDLASAKDIGTEAGGRFTALAGATAGLDAEAGDADSLTPLARAEALVNASAGTRDSIADLLGQVTLEPGPAGGS